MNRVITKTLRCAFLSFALVGCTIMALAWQRGETCELYLRHSARVFEDGRIVSGAHVFNGSKGHVLLTEAQITEAQKPRSAAEIFFPDYSQVLDCEQHTFLDLGAIGLQVHERNGEYPCAGSGKQEIRQEISSTPASLSFNHWHWDSSTDPMVVRRIEIRW